MKHLRPGVGNYLAVQKSQANSNEFEVHHRNEVGLGLKPNQS